MTQGDLFTSEGICPAPGWRELFEGPSTAIFSECGLYRRGLSRDMSTFFDTDGDEQHVPPLVCIGLNPSTADAMKDDATIRRDKHFTRAWGFGRFVKLNAYDYRSTDPGAMFKAERDGTPINTDDNNRMILRVVDYALGRQGKIWVAWGGKISERRQRELACDLLGDVELWCINTNQDGTPVHELYQPNDSVLRLWYERPR